MLALGIISIVLGFVSTFTLWWLSIFGLIFGIIAIGGGASDGNNGAKVTGIIGTVFCAIDITIMIVFFALA